MTETPTFGRYAEIPYDEMTPEQQEGYRFAVETRGPLGGPNKIWVHNPELEGRSAVRRPLPAWKILADRARAGDRRHNHQQQMASGVPDCGA
jgi:hypothetical protein